MCGLAGFLTPPGRWTQHKQRLVLDRMLRVLRHRGPDEEGSYLEDGVALGIRRLKIQDLVTGSQPLRNEDGSVQLILNGEIYNAPALRSELEQRGHRFATHSDAEVLSHGYEEEGTGWLDRVRGMFAFALWDHKRQKLWLGRDRFGMKPLYYAELGQTVVFASELKAILQFPGIERQLDLAALDAYLTLEFRASETSALTDCRMAMASRCSSARSWMRTSRSLSSSTALRLRIG